MGYEAQGPLDKEGRLFICAGVSEFLVTPLLMGPVWLLSQGRFEVGTCESFFFVRIESRVESAVYTTQSVTQPDGLQAYCTGP